MGRGQPDKEATLGEVLAEVSLTDIGRMLKSGSTAIGCLAVYMLGFLVVISATDAAGYSLENWGIPRWIFWLLFVWLGVYAATSETSYHEWKMGWYFPKLNWLGSLVLAGYFVGFGCLLGWVGGLEEGIERGLAFFIIVTGYASPFLLFLSALSVGHAKLMEKRSAALAGKQSRAERPSVLPD